MSLTRQPAKRRTLARTRLRANRQVINSCYISVIPKLSSSPEGGRTVTRLVGRAEGRFGSTIAVFFHSWFDRCKGQRDRLLSTGSNPANAGEGRPHGSDPPGTHPAPLRAPPGNIFRILLNIFRSRATRRALPPARGNSDRTGRCAVRGSVVQIEVFWGDLQGGLSASRGSSSLTFEEIECESSTG